MANDAHQRTSATSGVSPGGVFGPSTPDADDAVIDAGRPAAGSNAVASDSGGRTEEGKELAIAKELEEDAIARDRNPRGRR